MKTIRLLSLCIIMILTFSTDSFAQCNFTITVTRGNSGGIPDPYFLQANMNPVNWNMRYTYSWSTGVSSIWADTICFHNIPPAACVTVTDTTGCSVTSCDSAWNATHTCTLTAGITSTQTAHNATLTATSSGAHGRVRYHWSTGDTISQITVSANGNYCVTVTDSAGCSGSFCRAITGVCNLNIHINQTPTATYVTAAAATTGANGALSFAWSSGEQDSSIMIGLTDRYCVTVTDATCSASFCDSVHAPCTMNAFLNQAWTGANLGLAVNASGSGTINYNWSVPGAPHTYYYSPVTAPGTYCVDVSDANCTIHLCDTIITACNLYATLTPRIVSGVTTNYHLTYNAVNRPVTFAWTIDGALLSVTDSVLPYSAIPGGTHIVCGRVTDARCTDSACAQVTNGTACSLLATLTDTIFNTHADIQAHVSGAHGPVHYSWSIPGATGATATALISGTYCLTATDSAGCSYSACVTVHVANCALIAHINTINYGSRAVLTALASGGHGAVSYHWSSGAQHDTIIALHSGAYCVTVSDSSGCALTLCDTLSISAVADTICGTVFNDINSNGVQDTGEHALPNRSISIYDGLGLFAHISTDASGHYSYSLPAAMYQIRYTDLAPVSFTIPLHSGPHAGAYDSVTLGGGHHCGYDFGVIDSTAAISGYVYFDTDHDGVRDSIESGQPYACVRIGAHYVYTDAAGFYTYVGNIGSYQVSYAPYPYYLGFTVAPAAGYNVAATAGAQTYSGNDFGIYIDSAACNIAVQIVPQTTVTAGFSAWYYTYIFNYGASTTSGTVTFTYDSALHFQYATPNMSSLNQTNRTISFTYSGLAPGTYKQFLSYFDADIHLALGQATHETATATSGCTESNYTDNTDTVQQNVTGSWDPNEKLVSPSGKGPQGYISASQELQYTIHFQNTGTAPAVNVVLVDSLPASLDPSTVRVIATSHPRYALQIDGHRLLCRFSQIMLPDSSVSDSASQGFLSFAVKLVSGLTPGTQIQNSAAIYFDYNNAVITAATLNTIENPLSLRSVSAQHAIMISPNPFSDYTTIRVLDIPYPDMELQLFDVLGQKVSTNQSSSDGVFVLRKNKLSSGVYQYAIRHGNELIGTGKITVE